jgi:predicted dehydrogenase
MYSERLEVKAAVNAGELVRAGAIGDVIQTINIAPHQIVQRPGGDAGSAGRNGGRPDWFWNEVQFGGILCDIGSHQVDQFLYYTGSTQAEVVASQVANVRHPDHPHFQDFGDMMLRGNNGFGYVRLDWFTPHGLGTWGDGRLFILGTEGYIELRKYTNVAVSKQGNHLFVVDQKQARYIDCNNLTLPFGSQFVSDIVNRTHTAQDQAQCLLAAELVIKAGHGEAYSPGLGKQSLMLLPVGPGGSCFCPGPLGVRDAGSRASSFNCVLESSESTRDAFSRQKTANTSLADKNE